MTWTREKLADRLEKKTVLGVYTNLHGQLIQLPLDGKAIHGSLSHDIAILGGFIQLPDRGGLKLIRRETWEEMRERDVDKYKDKLGLILEIVNKYTLGI